MRPFRWFGIRHWAYVEVSEGCVVFYDRTAAGIDMQVGGIEMVGELIQEYSTFVDITTSEQPPNVLLFDCTAFVCACARINRWTFWRRVRHNTIPSLTFAERMIRDLVAQKTDVC